MQKFQGHVLNPSRSSDNAGFPTLHATVGTPYIKLLLLFFCLFLGLYPWYMEVPRLGVKWDL